MMYALQPSAISLTLMVLFLIRNADGVEIGCNLSTPNEMDAKYRGGGAQRPITLLLCKDHDTPLSGKEKGDTVLLMPLIYLSFNPEKLFLFLPISRKTSVYDP